VLVESGFDGLSDDELNSIMVGLSAQASPGTEVLDVATGHQNTYQNVRRLAETKSRPLSGPKSGSPPCSAPYRKLAVCKDWMVVCAVGYELVSIWNSLLVGNLQGFPPIQASAGNLNTIFYFKNQ
jgi:hypothetical protein